MVFLLREEKMFNKAIKTCINSALLQLSFDPFDLHRGLKDQFM